MLLQEQENVSIETIELNDGLGGLSVTFGEEGFYKNKLDGYSVIVMADSLPAMSQEFLDAAQAPDSTIIGSSRLTTIVARFPRCVLSEVNTHRVFSRNSASSRAKSVKVTIADVMNEPYIPVFTENQKGMSGSIVSEEAQARSEVFWLAARDRAVASTLELLLGRPIAVENIGGTWESLTEEYYNEVYLKEDRDETALNLHKQNVNRILEPYMWHEAVISATEWENFIELRDHDEADPAIHSLGRLVKLALLHSEPTIEAVHAPFARNLTPKIHGEYVNGDDNLNYLKTAFHAMDYTSGASAQVSYRPVVGGGTGADPVKLANRLLAMKHMSPFEHSAVSVNWATEYGLDGQTVSNFSNFWHQYRQLVPSVKDEATQAHLENAELLIPA